MLRKREKGVKTHDEQRTSAGKRLTEKGKLRHFSSACQKPDTTPIPERAYKKERNEHGVFKKTKRDHMMSPSRESTKKTSQHGRGGGGRSGEQEKEGLPLTDESSATKTLGKALKSDQLCRRLLPGGAQSFPGNSRGQSVTIGTLKESRQTRSADWTPILPEACQSERRLRRKKGTQTSDRVRPRLVENQPCAAMQDFVERDKTKSGRRK